MFSSYRSAEKYGKLVQMYERELSIPLLDMEETYIELKVLNERERERYAVDWPALDVKYNKAKEELQKMLPFENRLTALDEKEHQTRANIYMEYISMAVDFLSDKIVQVLYERMVTDCCLNRTNCIFVLFAFQFLKYSVSLSILLASIHPVHPEPKCESNEYARC